MNIRGITALAAMAVSSLVLTENAFAQFLDDEPETVDEVAKSEPAAAEEGDALEGRELKGPMSFYEVIRCAEARGCVEVLCPRTENWVRAQTGKFYPYGSIVRASETDNGKKVQSSALFDFGKLATVKIDTGAEFATREIKIGDSARTLVLRRGRVELNLPRSLKNGEFSVAAPHFALNNMSGESWIDYSATETGDTCTVHLTTGLLSIEGSHYTIPQMRAGDQIRIITEGDDLYSMLVGEFGIYGVVLDQGVSREKDPLTGAVTERKESFRYELAPKCAIKLWRRKATVGGRMVVATMALDAAGNIKSRRTFAENRYEVNSGELVVSAKDLEAMKDVAKDDSAAAETEEVPVEAAPAAAPAAPADAGDADDLF